MNITTIDVISVNGKIAPEGDTSHTWTSSEDWNHFLSVVREHNLLVMGSGTYDTVRPQPQSERLRIVLTHQPEQYKADAVPGSLEFVKATPQALVKQLTARGYTSMLLVGGQVNTEFMAAGLVNQMFVTVEPVVFGAGQHLLDGTSFRTDVQLQSVLQLNKRGTLLLHYVVK